MSFTLGFNAQKDHTATAPVSQIKQCGIVGEVNRRLGEPYFFDSATDNTFKQDPGPLLRFVVVPDDVIVDEKHVLLGDLLQFIQYLFNRSEPVVPAVES